MLTVNAVATEPFTDFGVDRVSRLSITRTYSSADSDYEGDGPGGVFGVAWHHEWEAKLACSLVNEGSTQRFVCVVTRGLEPGFKFSFEGAHESPDGSQTWNVYTAYAPPSYAPAHRNILVSRPDGEWIAFLTDGSELHFRSVCTSCDSGTRWCTAVENGGSARLVLAVDPRGNKVALSYDPAGSVPLRLTDDLGHTLEVRSAAFCSPHATELRYDGATVARYSITGNMLRSASDAEGRTLRSYVYPSIGASWPYQRLRAVLDESGTAIAEFSYDSQQRAVGLVDASSSLTVAYGAMWAEVTEHFRGPSGDTTASSTRSWDWNRRVTSIVGDCACGSPRATTWTKDGQISCSVADGIATSRDFDGFGRTVYVLERSGQDCSAPGSGSAMREEWFSYGLLKAIATGVTLPLDTVTAVNRRSTVATGSTVGDSYDYSQDAKPTDPAGYACAPSGLPSDSVLCRTVRSGYAREAGGAVLMRYATYYSYDERGRLIRSYGPVTLDAPGPNDIPPLEERTYWADNEGPARQGRLHEIKSYATPTGQPLVTTFDYDMFGIYRITRPDGAMTTFIKDGRGRPMFTVEADAGAVVRAKSETRYYDGLLPRLRVLPAGRVERFSYDSKGRLSRLELLSADPEAAGAVPNVVWVETYLYDASGNRVHTERADGQGRIAWQQDRAYDARHRVVSETAPGISGGSRSFAYSGGVLSSTIDEAGRTTRFASDPLNRVSSVVRLGADASGNPVSAAIASYAFAPFSDRLESVSDGSSRTSTYSTDDFGRNSTVDSPTIGPGRGRWSRYDPRGNIVARGDLETTVWLAYDGLDRLIVMDAQNTADGSTVHHGYRYDEGGFAGRLTTRLEPGRTVTFTYDYAGRILSETTMEPGAASSLTTAYAYDAEGALRQVAYPSGLAVAYERDAATGAITAVRDANTGRVFADLVERLPFGPVAALTFGNGQTLARTFDTRYEPLGIESGPLRLIYTPSPEGGFSAVLDRSQDASGCIRDDAWSVSRDLRDRLKSWGVSTTEAPGVCPAPSSPGAVRYAYVSGTDLLSSASDGNGRPTYAFGYDARANVSAVSQLDPTGNVLSAAVCLRHDALGRLVTVGTTTTPFTAGAAACTTDGWLTSSIATFRYDALNRRIARSTNGAWTYFSFDSTGRGLSEMAQRGGSWAPVRDYVWLDDLLLAQVEYVGSAARGYFAHVDHLGTPRALTSDARQVVWSVQGEPYGDSVERTAADAATGRLVVTNLRLPGQYDERLFAAAGLTGLQGPYYNWNRWYLPSMGRYMELDPVALEGGFNAAFGVDWYGYARQNPLSWTDEDGLMPSPTGPYHPPPPETTPSCKGTDDCPTIQNKMMELQAMIYSHTHWDANVPYPNGGSRHLKELKQLWGNYAKCQSMYRSKCSSGSSCGPVCKTVTVLVGIGVAVTICVQPETAPVLIPLLAP
jgi:RHS repeat-associated protein